LAVQNHFFLLGNSNYSSVETHNNAQMHVKQQLNDYEHPLLIHTLILSLSLSGGPCVNDCFSFSKPGARRPLKRFIILFSSVSCYWYTLDFFAPLISCSSQIKRNNSVWWEQTKSCPRTSPTKSTRSNHLFKSINKMLGLGQ